MQHSRILFTWPVAIGGYRWITDQEAERYDRVRMGLEQRRADEFGLPPLALAADPRLLVEANPAAGIRLSRPFEGTPALHRALAHLPTTEAQVARFAGKWGMLGTTSLMTPAPADKYAGRPIRESVSEWQYHVGQLAAAVRLYDAIAANDTDGMQATIPLVDPNWTARTWTAEPPPSAIEARRRAREALGDKVRVLLANYAMADLFLDDEGAEGGDDLGFRPRCLLGAAWLELAQAIVKARVFQPCERVGCHQWLDIELRSRTDRVYCSDTCKVLAYRARKRAEARGRTT